MGLGLAIAGAVTSIAATAIGTTMGVVGSIQQQKQSEANAKAQQAQAEYNARLAEREAKALEAESAENARRQHEESQKLKSAQRAAFGSSGVDMTSGSPLALLGATAAAEQRNLMDAHYTGYRQVQKQTEAAKQYRYQGAVARKSAMSKTAAGLQIAGQVAGGIGQTGSTLLNFGSTYNNVKR